MTIDYNKNDYTPDPSLPNIVYEVGKERGYAPGTTYVLSDFLSPLVRDTALKHREWKFICEVRGVSAPIPSVKVRVYQDTEEVGSIRRDHHRNEECFFIQSPRISNERWPRDAKRTTKEKVAAKHIKEFFRRSSHAERMGNAVGGISGKISSLAWESRRVLDAFWERRRGDIMRHLADSQGAAAGAIPGLEDALAAHALWCDRDFISKACVNSTGTVVITASEYYLIRRLDGGDTQHVRRADVDPDFGLKVTMLKLCEDNRIIPDVGFRLDENRFFILDTVKS